MLKTIVLSVTIIVSMTVILWNNNLVGKYLSPDAAMQLDRYQQVAGATIKKLSQPNGTLTHPPKTKLSYTEQEHQIKKNRLHLATQYKAAKTRTQKKHILNQARQSFINANTTLAPYWYGTPWDFHGVSQTPQQGSIACGYFVTTLLEDTGLKVQRAKLAQQASEKIIKSLTTEKHIKRFHNSSLQTFVHTIKHWGKGLYIVGLDFHVGFIWHDGKTVHFIHSTYVPPKAAFSEHAMTSPVLASSKYRVVGKISDDDTLIKKWLQETPIATKT